MDSRNELKQKDVWAGTCMSMLGPIKLLRDLIPKKTPQLSISILFCDNELTQMEMRRKDRN